MLASMSTELKLRLGFALLVMAALLLDLIPNYYLLLALTAAAYIVIAYPIVIRAFVTLVKRHRMSEEFLMTVATFGALGLQDFAEALAVMIFYQIGDAFEEYAAGRSHKEITALVKLKPSQARVISADGSESIVKPRKVKPGETIRVLAGEAVALDGELKSDHASIDMSALTGESEPQSFLKGQEVPSGTINLGGVIELKVTRDFKNASITRLLNLIEDAAANKSVPETLISRFAVYYTPIVVGCAVLLALVPFFISGESYADWFTRALGFLVVSCPCALVLSVPLSFFGGLGAISKIGVMVKGSLHIETLAKLKAIALDKTGTITQGKFSISAIVPNDGVNENEILEKLGALERLTTHPIGAAIVNYCNEKQIKQLEATDAREEAGFGLSAVIDNVRTYAGRFELMAREIPGVKPLPHTAVGTEVYLMAAGRLLGLVVLADEPKDSAPQLFKDLKQLKIKSVMITGDREEVAAAMSERLGISEYYAGMLPEDKLETFSKIKERFGATGFAGDGINDAPVLAAADVGIAMGQFGSAAAVEAADVVVMNDDLSKIGRAIELSRRTYALAKQNMVLVIAVKLLILGLGALGLANIWLAILGDVGLCIIAVCNAMRTLTWVK